MNVEDFFDFLAPDDIRIKGHRIGIETVLHEYLHRGKCAEDIQAQFPTLTLEEVYATVLYYLHNQEQVGRYVADWLEFSNQARRAATANPSPSIQRLYALKAEIASYPLEEQDEARKRIREREQAKHTSTVTAEAA